MNFTVREIEDRDSLAFFLKKQREEQGYNLSDVARKTLVAERYLEYIEKGDYAYLPGEVYFKNFIKRYVEFLGYTMEEIEENFQIDLEVNKLWSVNVKQPKLPLSFSKFITWPKVLRASLVSIIALLVFGYLGFTAYKFLQPPLLTVSTPQDKIVVQQTTIVVEGETDPSAEVTINQVPVIVEDGFFQQQFDLQTGINDIEIIATKKHGRFTTVNRQVIVAETPSEISKN